ncbi:hypothetical protein B0T10DRAFT_499636 [Thelonectria olida]|uniref:Chromo domain-containing protein n=1 Tax=Thelonectria olida TaxID=1576542 RepID=A0A9P8VR28_9HYPO|nr:hypothetical protein B0T10DRAFT_499636 [Thelonectria olida]
MARTRTSRINARATRQSRFIQLSRIFSAKTIAHSALTRRRQSVKQSDLKGFHANDKRNFPTEVSPLLVLASLNATESAISYSMGQMIDEQTETAQDTIMRDVATDVIQPSKLGPDVAYSAPRNHDALPKLDNEDKPMSHGKMEGGKDRKHLEGKKQKKNSAERKDTNKPEDREEPTDADHTTELAEPEEKRDDTEESRYEVEAIISHHTKNKTEVELMIKWTGCSEPTLVDERTFQQDCPLMLYRYWEFIGGREEATGINLFHVFRIRRWKVKDEKLQFLVEWVGYPPEDSTWELAWRVERCAKEMHTAYLKTHRAARYAWEKEKNRTKA